VEPDDIYSREEKRYFKSVYFPAIFPLCAPVQIPDLSGTHPTPLGLATVRMGFSTRISVVVVAVLTSEAVPIGGLGVVSDLPVVLIKGRFYDVASSAQPAPASEGTAQTTESTQVIEAARKLVEGNGSQQDRKDRAANLRRLRAFRATYGEVPVRIGSSIGTAAGEDRGTAGLYLKSSIGVRLLTAAHVATPPLLDFDMGEPRSQYIFPRGGSIASPSRLDCIKKMERLLRDDKPDVPQKLTSWLTAANRVCGTVQCGRLGVDEEEYREDWALIELQDGFVGNNRTWRAKEELEELMIESGLVRPRGEFTGKIVGVEDPVLETTDVWFKDRASTGWTVGTLISTEVELFLRGTTFGVTDSDAVHPSNIEKGKVHMMQGKPDEPFAKGGDSGSGVFKITQDGCNFVFGGMVLSEFISPTGLVLLTMVAPATIVLAQVAKATGVEWAVEV